MQVSLTEKVPVAVGFQAALCALAAVSQHHGVSSCTTDLQQRPMVQGRKLSVGRGGDQGLRQDDGRVPEQLKVKPSWTDWANIARSYEEETACYSSLCSQPSTLSCSAVGF